MLKKRFPVCIQMQSYSHVTQCKLVICAMMLHIFIRKNQGYYYENNNVNEDEDDAEMIDNNMNALSDWRDNFAARIPCLPRKPVTKGRSTR